MALSDETVAKIKIFSKVLSLPVILLPQMGLKSRKDYIEKVVRRKKKSDHEHAQPSSSPTQTTASAADSLDCVGSTKGDAVIKDTEVQEAMNVDACYSEVGKLKDPPQLATSAAVPAVEAQHPAKPEITGVHAITNLYASTTPIDKDRVDARLKMEQAPRSSQPEPLITAPGEFKPQPEVDSPNHDLLDPSFPFNSNPAQIPSPPRPAAQLMDLRPDNNTVPHIGRRPNSIVLPVSSLNVST